MSFQGLGKMAEIQVCVLGHGPNPISCLTITTPPPHWHSNGATVPSAQLFPASSWLLFLCPPLLHIHKAPPALSYLVPNEPSPISLGNCHSLLVAIRRQKGFNLICILLLCIVNNLLIIIITKVIMTGRAM